MHGYNDHVAFYQNREIHGPWITGSGPRAEPIWRDSIVISRNLEKSYSVLCPRSFLTKLRKKRISVVLRRGFRPCGVAIMAIMAHSVNL